VKDRTGKEQVQEKGFRSFSGGDRVVARTKAHRQKKKTPAPYEEKGRDELPGVNVFGASWESKKNQKRRIGGKGDGAEQSKVDQTGRFWERTGGTWLWTRSQ